LYHWTYWCRLHLLVFTPRDDAIRVISLRKTYKRVVKRYEQETNF